MLVLEPVPGLEPESVSVSVLERVPEPVWALVSELGLVPHRQLPSSQLPPVLMSSIILSFSPLYLLLKIRNQASKISC